MNSKEYVKLLIEADTKNDLEKLKELADMIPDEFTPVEFSRKLFGEKRKSVLHNIFYKKRKVDGIIKRLRRSRKDKSWSIEEYKKTKNQSTFQVTKQEREFNLDIYSHILENLLDFDFYFTKEQAFKLLASRSVAKDSKLAETIFSNFRKFGYIQLLRVGNYVVYYLDPVVTSYFNSYKRRPNTTTKIEKSIINNQILLLREHYK